MLRPLLVFHFVLAVLASGCHASGSVDAVIADAAAAPSDMAMPDLLPPVWPNPLHPAESDPWIAANHDRIVQMRPRVLALNFVNGRSNDDMVKLLGQIFAGLEEGSRYRGYRDVAAPAFLQYEIAKAVDLTDHPPPQGYALRNSTRYPRKPANSKDTWKFDYGALFSVRFAALYGIADPADAKRNLPLCELVERGMVHEIWIYGDADVPDVSAAEVLENKQVYDAAGNPMEGVFDPCAGNGCFDAADVPACKVSVRIPWVNNTRGPGCLLHSLGHGIENMGRTAVPALFDPFRHFANFDLDDRFQTGFESWYAICGGQKTCLAYKGDNALDWHGAVKSGTMDPLDQGCGNVHYAPNARADYDDQNDFAVLSTCEHYGMHDGAAGRDAAEPYTAAKSRRYDALAPDCGGGWQVYWRQSFPGYGNSAKDAMGHPMHNWWPYLYY